MESRGRRPRRRDEGGFSADEGHEGGGYGYGRGGGGYGDGDEEVHEGRIQDMGQAFIDLLYGYAVDKAHIIPTRPKKLSALASGLTKTPVQKMLDAQTPEEREMNDFINTLQHWHFEPANPFKREGQYQSCEVRGRGRVRVWVRVRVRVRVRVDRLLSHHEEYALPYPLP